MLCIQPSGSKSWAQRIVIQGRRCIFGLGGYPATSLKEARRVAFENRALARQGGDPLALRARRDIPDFAAAAGNTLRFRIKVAIKHAIRGRQAFPDGFCLARIDDAIVGEEHPRWPICAMRTTRQTASPTWKPTVGVRVSECSVELLAAGLSRLPQPLGQVCVGVGLVQPSPSLSTRWTVLWARVPEFYGDCFDAGARSPTNLAR